MYKSILLFLLLVLVGTTTIAQETQQTQVEDSETIRKRNEVDQRVYQLAMRYNDLAVARVKLMELIERNPSNNRYLELLATIYFESNQFSSAAVSALDLLDIDDQNVTGLEVASYSLEQIGAVDRALPLYERLYLLSGDIISLYKSAYLQYSLKRYEESLNSINMLVKNSKSEEEKLEFPKSDQTIQEVSVKAAALTIKGLVYLEQGSTSEAKASFEESLALHPDFELAKQNLANLAK